MQADRLAGQLHLRGHRPAGRVFRAACARQGVNVGRDFPPFEHSHVRISIGTMEEMKRATTVFRDVLRPVAPVGAAAAAARPSED